MKKVFFDTWGWLAIACQDDVHHSQVFTFYKTYLVLRGIPITTDYVLAETITLLRGKTEPKGVAVFIDTILAATKQGRIRLERIDGARWEKAWELAKKYSDNRSISFVDLTSFVVMKEIGVRDALTADSHFEEAGLGLRKLF